uniref:Uncharacterized protein n=2 Tax=Canis lupus familiaris TaxID=9615 RepID=A0A8C0SQZ3_CANLF
FRSMILDEIAKGGSVYRKEKSWEQEEDPTRIGPGPMASKEEQTVKNLNVENANQENKRMKRSKLPIKKSPCPPPPLQASEYCGPRVNPRRFRVKQPNLQYRWDWEEGETAEEKADGDRERGKQFSHSLWVVSADPPHQDHYDEVCFMS